MATDLHLEPSARPLADLLAEELEFARATASGRLPPERELAARLGLSRSAVRRWLDDLERVGSVSRHVGRGTFVQPTPGPDEATAADATTPSEIMAVRLLLEPQLLGLTVSNATTADIAAMRSCLAAGEAAAGFEEFEQWDSRLHATIAASTHNSLLIRLFEEMNRARDHPLWGSAKRRSFTPERRAEYEQDHRELVRAVEDRDPTEAAAVMRRHLQRIRSALLGTDG